MKKNIYKQILGLLTISVCFSCCNFHNDHNIRISVKESSQQYRLHASYSRAKTNKVRSYINECIQPVSLNGNYVDITTTLDDNTRFYIKSLAGELLIKLNKTENSEASYHRIKKMCEGIKEVLKDEN